MVDEAMDAKFEAIRQNNELPRKIEIIEKHCPKTCPVRNMIIKGIGDPFTACSVDICRAYVPRPEWMKPNTFPF